MTTTPASPSEGDRRRQLDTMHAHTTQTNQTRTHTDTHLIVMYKISDAVAVVTDGPKGKHFIPYCSGIALESLKWRSKVACAEDTENHKNTRVWREGGRDGWMDVWRKRGRLTMISAKALCVCARALSLALSPLFVRVCSLSLSLSFSLFVCVTWWRGANATHGRRERPGT